MLSTRDYFLFFFFQAEDGIRDLIVTGVQTCALPILVLLDEVLHHRLEALVAGLAVEHHHAEHVEYVSALRVDHEARYLAGLSAVEPEIGRASCRERV